MVSAARLCSLLLLLAVASGYAPPQLRPLALGRRRPAVAMQEEGGDTSLPEPAPVEGSVAMAPSLGPDGQPDLSKMSFDERLEYLASVAPTVAPPKEEDDVSMFGIGDAVSTKFWSPEFIGLCFQDLREMTWPSPKSVAQTVVTSQIAFIALFIAILVFDAFAEATVRTLVQGKPFVLMLDGSASPSRGM